MDKFFTVFGKIVLILAGTAVLVGGGFFLAKNSGLSLNKTSPANSQISTEATAQPSPVKTVKTITAGVPKSAKLSFSEYSISFPEDWVVNDQKDASLPSDKLILTKGNYSISIYQAATGGGQCIYPGDPAPEGPASTFGAFTEFSGTAGISFRRASVDSGNITTQNFGVCVKTPQNSLFGQPTQFGHVLYTAPKTYDQAMLSEMDSIVTTLKATLP